MAGLSDQQRATLAEELGYRQIGKDLPDDVTLQRVVSTLPKDVSPIFAHWTNFEAARCCYCSLSMVAVLNHSSSSLAAALCCALRRGVH